MTKVSLGESKFSRCWTEGIFAKFHSKLPASGGDGMISITDLDAFHKEAQNLVCVYIITYKEPGDNRWRDCLLNSDAFRQFYNKRKEWQGEHGPYFHIKWSDLSALSTVEEKTTDKTPPQEETKQLANLTKIDFYKPNPTAATIATLLLNSGIDPNRYFDFDGAGKPVAFKVG